MADSSWAVSAFSAFWDWKGTIAAAISASAPNRPNNALRRTLGRPSKKSGVAVANPLTRLIAYGNR